MKRSNLIPFFLIPFISYELKALPVIMTSSPCLGSFELSAPLELNTAEQILDLDLAHYGFSYWPAWNRFALIEGFGPKSKYRLVGIDSASLVLASETQPATRISRRQVTLIKIGLDGAVLKRLVVTPPAATDFAQGQFELVRAKPGRGTRDWLIVWELEGFEVIQRQIGSHLLTTVRSQQTSSSVKRIVRDGSQIQIIRDDDSVESLYLDERPL